MRNLFFTLLFLLSGLGAFSQPTFDLSFTEVTNDGVNYVVDVNLSFSATAKLSSSNFVFNFNNATMSSPVYVANSTQLGPTVPVPAYTVSVTEPETGKVSVNVVQPFLTYGTDIGTTSIRVAQISFTVDNPGGMTNFNWVYLGDGATTGTVVFESTGTATNQLNAGTLTDLNSPTLPVELISFAARPNKKQIELEWEVAWEEVFSHYEVQRSEDGRKFHAIGNVIGRNANYYSFTDDGVRSGILYYYRLRNVDLDGSFEYSEVVTASLGGSAFRLASAVYPNPVASQQDVHVALETENTTIQLIDSRGRLLKEWTGQLGSNKIDTNDMLTGMYFIRLSNNGRTETHRVVIQE